MSETETHNHEIELRLTEKGKLPKIMYCPECGAPVKRKKIVLNCSNCESTTYLELPIGRDLL
jgi:Zn finger protein HypA/HybF involved in hydrogenase expression